MAIRLLHVSMAARLCLAECVLGVMCTIKLPSKGKVKAVLSYSTAVVDLLRP
eukprot:COSAG05_NODE_335_length_11205_cov_15.027102_2_plen_52_part_00